MNGFSSASLDRFCPFLSTVVCMVICDGRLIYFYEKIVKYSLVVIKIMIMTSNHGASSRAAAVSALMVLWSL